MPQVNDEFDLQWYIDHDVAPPSHEEHLAEEAIAEILSVKRTHDWRQRGPVLFCVACPWEHATEPRFVDYILQGTDANGDPIVKKLT